MNRSARTCFGYLLKTLSTEKLCSLCSVTATTKCCNSAAAFCKKMGLCLFTRWHISTQSLGTAGFRAELSKDRGGQGRVVVIRTPIHPDSAPIDSLIHTHA